MLKNQLFLILLGIFGLSSATFAQENSITFQAKDLQLISQRYTGQQTNWPLIVEMASHDSEGNTFTLSPGDVLKLQNFSSLAGSVAKQRSRIQSLISSGASIFAPNELKNSEAILDEYKRSIQNGDLEEASTQA